jgi:type IV pilus assembly protein PilE
MSTRPNPQHRGRPVTLIGPRRGFTLVELVIVLVVAGVLAAIAFPSFQRAFVKSRRSEALTALSAIQQAQERWRSDKTSYAASLTNAASATPPGLGWGSSRTSNGYYDLAVQLEGTGTTTHVASATAVTGTSQVRDEGCQVLAVRTQGGNLLYGGGNTLAAINWSTPDPNNCWPR